MEELCEAYSIPSIDFGPEIVARLRSGTLLFKPTRHALKPEANQHADLSRNYEGGRLIFTRDGCHPVKEGHEIYRDIVVRSMETAIFPASGAALPHDLPNPKSKNSWTYVELVPSAVIVHGTGWHPIDVGADSVYRETYGRTHQMLRGGVWTDREGVAVTLRWTDNMLAFSDIPQSREEPMELEVSIDGKKPYSVMRQRTLEPRIYSRFWYLPEQPWGEHTVTVTLKKPPTGQRWFVGQF